MSLCLCLFLTKRSNRLRRYYTYYNLLTRQQVSSDKIYTGYFKSDNETGGIENATHNIYVPGVELVYET
jgi:hypothetical protein